MKRRAKKKIPLDWSHVLDHSLLSRFGEHFETTWSVFTGLMTTRRVKGRMTRQHRCFIDGFMKCKEAYDAKS